MKKVLKTIGRIFINVIMTVFLAIVLVLNAVTPFANPILEGFLGAYSVDTDENKLDAYLKEGMSLAEQVEGEGIVLLKNDNRTLPLSEDVKKVNVFGWASTEWIGSGSGSAQITGVTTDFLAALLASGISYNTQLTDMYGEFLAARPYTAALSTYSHQLSRLHEPSVGNENYYPKQMLNDAKDYSDTAIVVLGRYTGESNDCPKVQYKVSAAAGEAVTETDVVTDESRPYLGISTEEEELLTYVGQNFENVIVLVNSTNTMELGFLDTIPGIDACVLAGATGADAATAIPKVLYGEITPSGRTTDTYAYDMATAAAYANSGAEGEGRYLNAEGMYPADGVTTNGNVGDAPLYEGVSFVDYTEGIYVGYRWYETADAEGFWDTVDNVYGTGYDGVVQFPFGYGMSYTSFDWEITDALPSGTELAEDSQIDVTVKVTNTGDVPGKDVVELYVTPPYIEGGIEKSSVALAAFAKTSELAPGESEEVTLTLTARDMASYDCYDANKNGFCGYELDEGVYELKLMTDSHTLKNDKSVLSYTVGGNIRFTSDETTGANVVNRFTGADAADGISVDGSDSDADITYLTRVDFAGTFESERDADRVMTDNLKETNLYTQEAAEAWIDPSDADITTGADNGLSIYDRNGFTELAYELGADYDNAKWDALLDQLTVDEMENLVMHGYSKTAALPSVGKIQAKEYDGPSQMGGFTGMVGTCTAFPDATVIAQTWNTELAYRMGYIEGLQAGQQGIEGWYAPSANIHRTPLGGRNYEYYSEDGFLSGIMAAQTVAGAKNTGMYCYMKHLIGYEQDTNRDGLYTWMTEQALREIYLKPFEIAIKDGGLTGIMTSYNRIGAIWAGGSEALLTNVVREEFGFNGTILTDYCDHHIFMNGDQMLRAGGDLWMDGMLVETKMMYETESNSYRQALRESAKHIIYTWLDAAYTNKQYVEETGEDVLRPVEHKSLSILIKLVIVADIIAAVLLFFWIRGIIRRHKKNKAAREVVRVEVK